MALNGVEKHGPEGYSVCIQSSCGCCHLPTSYSLKTWAPNSSPSSPHLHNFSIHVGASAMIFFIHSYNYTLNTTTQHWLWAPQALTSTSYLYCSLTSASTADVLPSLVLQFTDGHSSIRAISQLYSPVFNSYYVQRKFQGPHSLEKNLLSLMYSAVKNLTLDKANYLPVHWVGAGRRADIKFHWVVSLRICHS